MDADLEHAADPEDLSRLIVVRLNTGDVEGLVALYESDAVLALPEDGVANGSEEIRGTFERLLEGRPVFEPGSHRPTLRAGKLALTSTRLPDGTVTVEVARQQDDGTWLWVIDQPAFIPPNT
ncbi:YybH family protein [Paractinoplanes hotanensis]|uniref:Ketosteroid isomerase family protein n=1 Tax=Paractinoplanes hotanensis TaxID=2906497 RepID=A0ABT0YGB9_9ACTN|nr:ketosteroid isomerase family protein [Actinoplanes hotanensis]MCM4084795.1 ketosteroid isomerase family protein [Actinoplanes hotanensis]